jgi:hypothetical protein
MTLDQVERQLRVLKIYAVLSTVTFLIVVVAVTGYAQSQRQRFAEINVERINIVEPDGRPAMVIANSRRMARVILEGKELESRLAPQRRSAGMIFVDQQGNEVGGLIYGATVNADGSYNATRSFTLDQHNQDQVVGIQYQDNGSARSYGLSMWDRPAQLTLKEMVTALAGTTESQSVEERLAPIAKAKGITRRPGLRRVFLGSQNGTPALRLSDVEGRERVRMLVDADNTPRIEFLDEHGKVTYSVPQR